MSGKNQIIGFVSMPLAFAYCQSFIAEKQEVHIYNLERSDDEPIRKVTNVDLKDQSFSAGIVFSFGSLATFATGSLAWMAPGAALVLSTLPRLVYAEIHASPNDNMHDDIYDNKEWD